MDCDRSHVGTLSVERFARNGESAFISDLSSCALTENSASDIDTEGFVMEFSIPIIRRAADSDDPNSYANKLRAKRFRQFQDWIAPLPRPVRMLDVGGTNVFWELRGWAGNTDFQIVTLNVEAEDQRYANIQPIAGDATNLQQFGDCSFDVVFSNSVIEHLFTFENQRRMASEVQRVGKRYWVQSPNYWFPMEPHFQIPGWQWMPVGLRVAMLRRWRCGWRGPLPDPVVARNLVDEVQLLTKRQLRVLFPGATLLPERFCGLIKSWSVVSEFPTNGSGSEVEK